MSEVLPPALKAVSDAVLAIASELSVDRVLQRLVDAARELSGARYAALGIPDGDGGFRRFLVSGMSDELIARLGPLPRTHGMLGAMLETSAPHRTADLQRDPRFRGWWPDGHPDMRSFMGVPIIARGEVIAAFYLTDKIAAGEFDASDQALIELLGTHAAIAITNARLYERSRELSIVEERNRLALELHDAVSQKLFSLVLAAEVAATQLERDPQAARAQVERVGDLARQALGELRTLILGLRPPELQSDGLAGALRKEAQLLERVHGVPIELRLDAEAPAERASAEELSLLRIAGEALHNAVRHGAPSRVRVELVREDGRLVLAVRDDGVGFDPANAEVRSRHLGITSMQERARELGGTLRIDSAPGNGTTVVLEVPA